MKLFVADWSVNKNTFDSFVNFLIDSGFDVSVNGYNMTATNGKKTLYMFKGFKYTLTMCKWTKKFKEFNK